MKGKNNEKTAENNAKFLDSALRPDKWAEYIGQEAIKKNLRVMLSAAEKRGQPPEHILFYGPPGLGKTTLAHLIAKEGGSQLKVTSGPAIEKVGDLASILSNLEKGDILFIDEIHRLSKMVEEVLYPAMESGTLNIIIGKGPAARTIQLELPPFTIIAATTRVALVSSPLRSRFSGGVYRLEFYNRAEISSIIKRSSKILEIELPEEAIDEISMRSRFTPRIANHLLKRCRDFAEVNELPMSKETVKKALDMLEIDEIGLNTPDRKMIEVLIDKFGGRPVGLKTLAAAISEEEATIEEVHEPYLIQVGFLERTPRGRIPTKKAYKHLGFDYPEDKQQKL
ncbi:MAG: Holliday junction branch migration DNA helicase RuvB [Candidatus Paceibacterota bacterium]|jgi:Holliday junction DNA helicase RuvB